MAKRKRLSDAMKEALDNLSGSNKKPIKNPLLDFFTLPKNLIGPGEPVERRPLEPGDDPLKWIREKWQKKAEKEGQQRQIAQSLYRGKSIKLPDIITEDGKKVSGHLWFRSYTPDRVLDAIKNDPQMLTWAAQWSAPGGNVYAELMFWNKYYEMFGVIDNPNIEAPEDGETFEDSRHFFDWMKWKQEYNELHHGIVTEIRGNR